VALSRRRHRRGQPGRATTDDENIGALFNAGANIH
jgi:hypothetical protein